MVAVSAILAACGAADESTPAAITTPVPTAYPFREEQLVENAVAIDQSLHVAGNLGNACMAAPCDLPPNVASAWSIALVRCRYIDEFSDVGERGDERHRALFAAVMATCDQLIAAAPGISAGAPEDEVRPIAVRAVKGLREALKAASPAVQRAR